MINSRVKKALYVVADRDKKNKTTKTITIIIRVKEITSRFFLNALSPFRLGAFKAKETGESTHLQMSACVSGAAVFTWVTWRFAPRRRAAFIEPAAARAPARPPAALGSKVAHLGPEYE